MAAEPPGKTQAVSVSFFKQDYAPGNFFALEEEV
jgi:hypothetical protein